VIRNSGSVLLDLGGDRRSQPIGTEGQAYFSEIPSSFRGRDVPIDLESKDFELTDPKRTYRLNGAGIYLAVKKRDGRISGRVQDDNGARVGGVSREWREVKDGLRCFSGRRSPLVSKASRLTLLVETLG
jgi:hypothetical protein